MVVEQMSMFSDKVDRSPLRSRQEKVEAARLKRRRSKSSGRRSSILLRDGTEMIIQPNLNTTNSSSAKFLEKTRKIIETVNEASDLAESKIKAWHEYIFEARDQIGLAERESNKPIPKSRQPKLAIDLLDLDDVVSRAFERYALANDREVAELKTEYTELVRRLDESNEKGSELQRAIEKFRQDLELDVRRIDHELEDLGELCNALGWRKQFEEAISSVNGSL